MRAVPFSFLFFFFRTVFFFFFSVGTFWVVTAKRRPLVRTDVKSGQYWLQRCVVRWTKNNGLRVVCVNSAFSLLAILLLILNPYCVDHEQQNTMKVFGAVVVALFALCAVTSAFEEQGPV